MNIRNISIKVSEEELFCILKKFLASRNIFIKDIKIHKIISVKNICYGIIRDINFDFSIHKIVKNTVYLEINKITFKGLSIPKKIIDIFLKFTSIDVERKNKIRKFLILINLESYMKNLNTKFSLQKINLEKGFANIFLTDISIENKSKKLKQYNKGGISLKLTQTTLKLSGEDIMSFVKDFIKTDKVILSGVDVSQAIYLKGIIINSFDLGDVSINIKDMKENLLYVQLKIINSIFPGVNIEHIPMKIFVKDILKSFTNLNLDLDVGSVKFIDECIEVKINNLNFDMKRLSTSSGNIFLR